ncbi:hypothetical protein C8F04DRAFT_1314949 [Mycena alexandri]|uniref:Uncharacterized protein n=1 Tax=Mycena alexandri TaxID=1745969 RepID=A0AAD6S4Z6_9AGAR|nr:hypothetical protein C8F04DRAFT_1314949 [Mycena alexandri]
MSLAPNPLHIPELVEHCIGLLAENLYGSHRRLALMSCALVARSWVNAAQSALLRAPHITNHLLLDEDRSERLLVLFHETLHNFPHLTHHVRDLSLDVIVDCLITQTTLDNICALPFIHLESVSLFLRKDLDYESALQQLFSHPTLLRIKLDTPVSNLLFFAEIWNRCSPKIRHLELFARFNLWHPHWRRDDPTCSVPIQLESLQMVFERDEGLAYLRDADVYPWAIYPFDLSHLKALSIRDQKGVPLERFVKTIRVLDVYDTAGEQAIDLSTFPNLSVLRISLNESISPMMLSTLSTVASSSIRTIIIDLNFYDGIQGYRRSLRKSEYPALDSILSTLPMPNPPTIEFEVTVDGNSTHETVMKSFPALKARNLLRLVRRREDVSDTWWKDFVDSV